MPLFHYQTVNQAGKKSSCVIEAASLEKAKEILRGQKILVTNLSSGKTRGLFVL